MSTERDDKELLIAAARAAGIALLPCTCSDKRWPFKHDEAMSGKRGHWNPLTDDGDALRLAVKLNIRVCPVTADGNRAYASHDLIGDGVSEFLCGDPCAATRRAIVRAAASLGERA